MKLKGIFDPFLVTGILFSIIVSLVLYITGVETVSSILVALLGIVITLQVEQIARAEQNIQRSMRYSELWSRLEKIPWLFSLTEDITEAVHAVSENFGNDLFAQAAKFQLEKCRNYLQELARGRLITSFDDNEAIISAVEETQTEILAISVSSVDIKWWNTLIGQRYWEANKRAIGRNVNVERVFAYDKWSSELESLADQQASSGAKIYMVPLEQIPPELRIDMIIMDENFTYEARLSSDGIPIENVFSINKSEISQKLVVFSRVKALANPFVSKIKT